MGLRGPPPTPTHLLRLRGSRRVYDRSKREAQGPEGLPGRPEWLDSDAVAAATWDQFVPMLEAMGVLTIIDEHMLATYCRLWSRWRKAEAFIDQHGEMYPLKDEKGQVKYFQQWPQVSIALKLAQQLTRLAQEFGLTPAARTRVHAQPPPLPIDLEKDRFFA